MSGVEFIIILLWTFEVRLVLDLKKIFYVGLEQPIAN